MATLSQLKPGQIVYSIWRGQVFPVRIIRIYENGVSASLNNNPETMYYERAVKTWRVKRPEAKR